ncbi:TetR/AcrR family transcriptional regulator [Promicromonospora panici]|uniref:TetR/AcrR family transcriptional regulator n=1 Tax=Promicromonospora panici TaxID=2219658 RepID=UPI00101DD490|nr:TetR/AcrR family transcriptional regulator [Promicromonospora panici]
MSAGRTSRQRPEVRRAMIVDAARQVLVRDGVAATGLRDIAAAADVSVGTVTYHFASVTEILNEVVARETERFYTSIIERADAEPDVVAAVRSLIAPLFDPTPEMHDHWRLWSDYWTTTAHRPTLSDDYLARIRIWEACMARTIRRGVESGVFRPVDPAETALKLAAYSDGIATQLAQKAPGLDEGRGLRWMWTFLDHELAGGGALFAV